MSRYFALLSGLVLVCFVHPWAIAPLALGLFVVAAVVPPRRFED